MVGQDMQVPRDQVGIEELMEHGHFVRALCHRLVADPDGALELGQETWARAIESPPSRRASLRGWLARVARTLAWKKSARDAGRQRRERRATRGEAVPDTASIAERRELLRAVMQAVLSLDEPYLSVVLQRFYENRPPREIAKRLGIPVATVQRRLQRALARMRAELSARDRGRGWRPALLAWLGTRDVHAAAAAAGTLVASGVVVMKTLAVLGIVVLAVVFGSLALGDGAEQEKSSVSPNGSTESAFNGSAESRESDRVVPTEPFSPEPDSEATAHPVHLVIIDAEGRAAPDARVVVFTGERVLATGTTNEEGSMEMSPIRTAADIAVVWNSPRVHHQQLAPGEFRVRLPATAEVAGRVRTRDLAPVAEVNLTLRTAVALDAASGLPPTAVSALGLEAGANWDRFSTTSEDGAFRFTGLDPSWYGSLRLPLGWVVADSDHTYLLAGGTIDLKRPDRALDLIVDKRPIVSGRVVWAESGQPVPRAIYSAEAIATKGSHSITGFVCDEAGRFRLAFPSQPIDLFRVSVSGPEGQPGASVDVEGSLERDRDLGDLALEPCRPDLSVFVRDPAGRPIRGALVFAGGSRARSEPTDETGSTVLARLGVREAHIRVMAIGFWTEVVSLPASVSRPLTVTLHPSNALLVRVRAEGGGSPEGLRVRLTCKEALFPSSRDRVAGGGEPNARERGPGLLQRPYMRSGDDLWLTVPASGQLSLTGLRPHVPFSLALLDATSTVLAAEPSLSLVVEEHREVVWTVDQPLIHWKAVVVDADGAPVPGAELMIETNGKWHRVAGKGGFTAGPFVNLRGRVSARAPGFAPTVLDRRPLEGANELTRIVLDRGRTLHVTVLDSDGNRPRIPKLGVSLETPPWRWRVSVETDGSFRVTGLPAGRVRLAAAGHTWWRDTATSQATCVLGSQR